MYSAGGRKSQDRTEPPIGAKVLLEVYRKHGDAWLVELLFDELLDWNDWFVASRMLGPNGLVSLGSDTIDGYADWPAGQMQGARYESGLDNSPMFDGTFFEPNASAVGSRLIGQMSLYDVGMESMFVQEAEALATLAPIAGKAQAVADKLSARAASHRKKMAEQLWDSEGQIFTDRFWNGSFYRRITPTSFYSMLATAATDEQASTMVTEWLLTRALLYRPGG